MTSPLLRAALFPPVHSEINKGHGRLETRSITASTLLNSYLNFPYCQQVIRLTRQRLHLKSGKREVDIVYGITSLPPEQASQKRLLAINRGHWSIENKSHYVRDTAYDEDRQQIRRKNGPRIMATLRNIAIGLLRLAGYQNITSALRQMAANHRHACAFLGVMRC